MPSDDSEMVSFEEAFGINPETGQESGGLSELDPDPPEPDDDEDDDTDDPPEDGTPADGEAPAAGSEEWRQEMLARFPGGEADAWRAYRELETRFSQRPPEAPPAPPPAAEEQPPPSPLLPGGVNEIRTEEDFVALVQANPEQGRDFALNNKAMLNEDQFNYAMNVWAAANPFQAMQEIAMAHSELLREQQQEADAEREAHYMKTIQDEGIRNAVAELPMINEYREDLAKFVDANPHLTTWIEGLRTAEQVKSALHSIFYQMAGPKLSQQILEQQVARGVEEAKQREQQAAADAEAQANAKKGRTMRRSTAQPEPGDDEGYAAAMQDRILNPGQAR
jgi:hypothetical protein